FPEPADPFLGRHAELRRLAEAVETSRLVTLVGPGGVGKTRLAIEFARAQDRDGWFVDLSSVTDPDAVGRVILDPRGVCPRADVVALDRIVEAAPPRRVLLVVDNCEQTAEAVAGVVGAIARATTDARVVATSRQPLNVSGEQLVVVAPLGLPEKH